MGILIVFIKFYWGHFTVFIQILIGGILLFLLVQTESEGAQSACEAL